MNKPITIGKIFLCLLFGLSAQNNYAQGSMLLRQPNASKDHIVFVHADDLWVVDHKGGDARRLTSAIGAESSPKISPNGKWVAFSGQYDGNTDVYIVPVEGGDPKRLTWHPGPDITQGWMPDGNAVFFTSSREGYPTVNTKFFKVSVNGGNPDALPLPFGFVGSISNDGATMTQFLFFLQETAFCDLTKGNFYVIEVNQHPAFLLNEAGEPQRFETYQ